MIQGNNKLLSKYRHIFYLHLQIHQFSFLQKDPLIEDLCKINKIDYEVFYFRYISINS